MRNGMDIASSSRWAHEADSSAIEENLRSTMSAWHIDWAQLFVPSGSLLEVVVRGTVLFLALFLLLRSVPRRQIGTIGVSDLLVIVLIADAAQNGLAGEYKSITEGVVLVGTILFWNWAIDWLDYRFPALQINGRRPRLLVSEGR